MEWNSPESEMVAYRSFSPFFHLILCYEAPQVQLWALWAIQHVCSKNGTDRKNVNALFITFPLRLDALGKRYCLMLYEEEGDEILASIAINPHVSVEVRQFCLSILELLKAEGLMRVRNEENVDLTPDDPSVEHL